MSTMEPADACKKGVLDWLNSSLWSSSRSSTSSSKILPSPSAASSSPHSILTSSHPQKPSGDTSVSAASDPIASDAEDTCQEFEEDKLIHREDVQQADESDGNSSSITEPDKLVGQRSPDIIEDEFKLNGPLP
ncbi:hypothetical protein L7F22_049908 [Adiantum nelumboides]|nr:hypothetical protein [Adiantum nelumboides]